MFWIRDSKEVQVGVVDDIGDKRLKHGSTKIYKTVSEKWEQFANVGGVGVFKVFLWLIAWKFCGHNVQPYLGYHFEKCSKK